MDLKARAKKFPVTCQTLPVNLERVRSVFKRYSHDVAFAADEKRKSLCGKDDSP